jgi:dephospho-CoA kinase
MKRVLITGMSGTGKSSVIMALAARGYQAVDADQPEFSELVDVPTNELTGVGPGKDWIWQEDRIQRLLTTTEADLLFVSGTSSNQRKFYPYFDHIVLLSAPPAVITERLADRTTNVFGKEPEELDRTLQLQQTIEPMLRRAADIEVDTRVALEDVIAIILEQIR